MHTCKTYHTTHTSKTSVLLIYTKGNIISLTSRFFPKIVSCFYVFMEAASLCSLGWLWTHYPPVWASQVLGEHGGAAQSMVSLPHHGRLWVAQEVQIQASHSLSRQTCSSRMQMALLPTGRNVRGWQDRWREHLPWGMPSYPTSKQHSWLPSSWPSIVRVLDGPLSIGQTRLEDRDTD